MKYLFNFWKFHILALGVVISLCSCNSNAKTNRFDEIRKTINKEQASLPAKLSPFYTIIDIILNEEKEMVSIIGELDSQQYNQFTNEQAESMIDALCLGNDEDSYDLLKEIVEAKIGIAMVFIEANTGNERSFSINADKIKSKVDEYGNLTTKQKKRIYLTRQAEIANQQCPIQVDYMTKQVSVLVDKGYKIHTYILDEDYADMNIFEYNAGMVKEQLISAFNSPMMASECRILKDAGMGLKFQYIGSDTKKQVEIVFTPDEIESLYDNIRIPL